LDTINNWRKDCKESLKLPLDVLNRLIATKMEKRAEFNDMLVELVKNKPNQPEISFDDYSKFSESLSNTIQLISELPDHLNTPDKLGQYCQQLHFTDMENINLQQISEQYQKEINTVKDKSLLECDSVELSNKLSDLEPNRSQLVSQMDTMSEQITRLDIEIEQLSSEIETKTDMINSVGEIIKPRKSLPDVKDWLRKFSVKQEKTPQNEQLLVSMTEKYNQLIKSLEIQQQIETIDNELIQIDQQKLPFNPKCSACCQQPWKIRHQQLLVQKTGLTAQLTNTDGSTPDEVKTKIDQLNQWLSDYHRYQKLLPEYREMETSWPIYEEKIQLLSQHREEKHHKQILLETSRKTLKDLKLNHKSITKQHEVIQSVINDVTYVINHRGKWDQLLDNIKKMEQYAANKSLRDLYDQYTALNVDYYQQQHILLDNQKEWDFVHNETSFDLGRINGEINQLKDNLRNVEQNVIESRKESYYIQEIANWHSYQQHQKQIADLQQNIYYYQLDHLNHEIEKITQMKEYSIRLTYWTEIMNNKPQFLEKQELLAQQSRLTGIIQNLTIQYEKDCQLQDQNNKRIDEVKEYDRLIGLIKTKQKSIDFVHKTLANYRTWLYSKIVIPQIVNTVNGIVNNVTQCNNYLLNATVSIDRYNKVNINWSALTPSGATSLNKVGGFYRNTFGLIMRISLSQMGCGISNTQLLIDEAFVSCDADNLEKMPTFLQNLLDFYPNGIIMVSHLSTIRDCSDLVITIRKNADMTSLILTDVHRVVEKPVNKCKLVLKQPLMLTHLK
jgi:hypothetical protein